MTISPYFRNLILASPLYFLSVVPFFWLAGFKGIEIELATFLYGALGWWIALLLRLPVIFYLKSKNRITQRVTSSVGPDAPITNLLD